MVPTFSSQVPAKTRSSCVGGCNYCYCLYSYSSGLQKIAGDSRLCLLFLRQILRTASTCLPYIEHAPVVWTQGQGQNVQTLLLYVPFMSNGRSLSPDRCKIVALRGWHASYTAHTYQDLKRTHSGPRMDAEATASDSFTGYYGTV